MGTFDPKRVPVTDWVVMGAGLLAFLASFLTWRSFEVDSDVPDDLIIVDSLSFNAWDAGFGAWFPPLLLLALGVVVALKVFGVVTIPEMGIPFGILVGGTGAFATVVILLRMLTFEDVPEGAGFSAGYGAGLWLGLLSAIAVAVVGFAGDRILPAKPGAAPPPQAPPAGDGQSDLTPPASS